MAGIEADGSGGDLFRWRRRSDTARLVMASVPASWAVALALARCCTGGRRWLDSVRGYATRTGRRW